jgi:pimeloyl-ACP methyl ester carboxylesterase
MLTIRYLTHFYNRLAYRRNVWTPDVLDFYTDAFSQSGAMRAGMDLYRAFHADAAENKEHLKKHGKTKVPCASFSGKQSFLASIAKGQTEELYEDVEVVEVEESGHWAAEENPEDCVKKILAFVGKQE